jgi:hypothetical protein
VGNNSLTTLEVLTEASIKELAVIFFFWFFPSIVILTMYVIAFRKLPFGNVWKDMKLTWQWLTTPPSDDIDSSYGGYNEDDYYEDIYGDDDADSRPRVRHPKNVDRAYNGGAERFHHGGR